MKKVFILLCMLGVICMYSSCKKNDLHAVDYLKSGYWSEKVSIHKLMENESYSLRNMDVLSTTVEHSISFSNNKLREYIDGQIIAEIPISIVNNNIIIYHPTDTNQVFSILTINDNHTITNQAGFIFTHKEGNVNTSVHLHAAASMDLCMRACRATHRLLGLPKWVDSICCFWYPAD